MTFALCNSTDWERERGAAAETRANQIETKIVWNLKFPMCTRHAIFDTANRRAGLGERANTHDSLEKRIKLNCKIKTRAKSERAEQRAPSAPRRSRDG